ncbi:MAG: lamin tail domain-containing protein [Verrucomicrobiota bacterium]
MPAVSADVRISEFLASNDDGLEDENGDSSDWIEIHNSGPSAVDLDGWSLTDKVSELQKWQFPQVILPAGGRLVIFASGKDRTIPGLPLHTNFALSKGGEYLALVESDGTTIATEFSPSYPTQATDTSYGSEEGQTTETVIALESPGRAGVPTSQSQFNIQFSGWNTNINGAFLGSAWDPITSGVGYETGSGTYGALIGSAGDVESEMHDVNPSIFIRLPFSLNNASQISAATLRMRWDDGFEAFLNGQPIAADRNPSTAAWNSVATDGRNDGLNDEQIDFTIDLGLASLNEGNNLLAIQGFNRTVDSSDMLIQPELVLTRTLSGEGTLAYFPAPSPGEANGLGDPHLAPIIGAVTDEATAPPTGTAGSPDLTLTAEVIAGTEDIQSVVVHYRTMFGPESTVIMSDNGISPDVVSGDGIYSATIPTSQVSPGEMLRWRFEATDVTTESRTSPLFADPLDSDRYYGTVADDPELELANLPVLQTFVEDQNAVDTRAGGRVSIYYLGRFYDNIQMDLHGQSTATFPKKSYDVDFNDGNRFRWKDGERKVKDINLLTNWADKSKVRNTLAYELYQSVGAGHHFAFPVRMERNGQFFSVTDMVEDGDDRYLERIGLDPDGALYKMYDKMEDPASAAKKTRKEEGTQDLQDLINNISTSLGSTQLKRNAYDHVDIAATVNHLVANQVIGITDTGHKNYYLYRDTEGSGEWRPLPWDVDLCFGRRWTVGQQYFDDNIYTGILIWRINPLWDLVHYNSEFRGMFVRRFETMRRQMHQSVSPPSATDQFRARVIEIEDMIDPAGSFSDADRDYNAWGSWGDMQDTSAASARIYNEWLPQHRGVIFSSGLSINGSFIPSTQPTVPDITIQTVEYNPSSGNQNEEYVIVKNNSGASVDLSGWTLEGAIDYTFPDGTVILVGSGTSASGYRGLIHIARDAAAFRSRSSGPTGGQSRYVQGGYSGQLSARGETLTLRTDTGNFVDDFVISPDPSPAQQYLRVAEINYHPADPTAAELLVMPALDDSDFEFVEIINIGPAPLILDGATFVEGIEFTFPPSTTLSAGGRIIIASNPAALALRYPAISVPVLGPFLGRLDNAGERLHLVDAVGENILDFSYSDDWYPPSDGGGASLVLRDTTTPFNFYDEPGSWGSSPDSNGSPGDPGTGYLIHFNGWQAEHYLPSEREPGQPGHPDFDGDLDGWTLWYEYALGTDPLVFDPPQFVAETNGSGATTEFGIRYPRRPMTSDVRVELLGSTSVGGFSPIAGAIETDPQTLGPRQESVLLHDTAPISAAPRKFYQLRITPITASP